MRSLAVGMLLEMLLIICFVYSSVDMRILHISSYAPAIAEIVHAYVNKQEKVVQAIS